MFGHSTRTATLKMDRHLGPAEQAVRRTGKHAASKAVDTADYVTEMVASLLDSLAQRYPGLSIGDDAMKFGGDAARVGNDALRRVSKEAANRPFVTLAVALGVGLLAGLLIQRR